MKSKRIFWIGIAAILVVAGLVWLHYQPAKRQPASRGPEQSHRVSHPPASRHSAQSPSEFKKSVSAAAKDIQPSALSPAVRQIVDQHADLDARLYATEAVSTNLTAPDLNVLYSFLLQPDQQDQDQLGQVLKNQLMDSLCEIQPPPAQLGGLFASVYRDHSQNVVIRDYAVQHLAEFYRQLLNAPDTIRQARSWEMSEAREVLWEATSETDNSIAGTALLALSRLSEQDSDLDRHRVARTALRLAGQSQVGDLTRITAFQICARMDVADALPLLEHAAQSSETVPQRISAIGALGSLGGAKQIPLLESLKASGAPRLAPALQGALARIEDRLAK